MSLPKWKPNLKDPKAISDLPRRLAPYWHTIEFCRHLGVQRHPSGTDYWMARVKLKERGQYCQHRLGTVGSLNPKGKEFDRALALAEAWFKSPKIRDVASDAYPVGTCRVLKYTRTMTGFTVGDALADYVEWKRVAATTKTFDASLSLINYHIVPRLGDVVVTELTSRRFTKFIVDILETPPKYGNQDPKPRQKLSEIKGEALRKRKKTVNTLLGILKIALQMAWENGEFQEERIWRTIRRLPHKDSPRHLFLSRDQCVQLLENCDSSLALIVLGALYTGCRISELADLVVADVEPGIRGIYVEPSKSFSGRYVFLPSEGLSFFRDQCKGKAPDQPVFRMKSGRSWNGNHKHLFKQAVRRSGLPDSFVFHGLRHTYASQLVQAGIPLAIVARQLGHSNTDTVSRTYGHLSCDCIEAELERRFSPVFGPQLEEGDRPKELTRGSTVEARGEKRSWPSSNFSKATDELVQFLKGR